MTKQERIYHPQYIPMISVRKTETNPTSNIQIETEITCQAFTEEKVFELFKKVKKEGQK